MAAKSLTDSTYVAHLVQRDGRLVTAAQHLRLNASSADAAKRRARAVCVGWELVNMRPAGPRDVQRWLHS